jgi:hypothetical protein
VQVFQPDGAAGAGKRRGGLGHRCFRFGTVWNCPQMITIIIQPVNARFFINKRKLVLISLNQVFMQGGRRRPMLGYNTGCDSGCFKGIQQL